MAKNKTTVNLSKTHKLLINMWAAIDGKDVSDIFSTLLEDTKNIKKHHTPEQLNEMVLESYKADKVQKEKEQAKSLTTIRIYESDKELLKFHSVLKNMTLAESISDLIHSRRK